MTKAEAKAREMIKTRSIETLVTDFELTDLIADENICIVRGWIMDELEARDPKAFDAWIEAFEDSPRRFFIK